MPDGSVSLMKLSIGSKRGNHLVIFMAGNMLALVKTVNGKYGIKTIRKRYILQMQPSRTGELSVTAFPNHILVLIIHLDTVILTLI